MEAVIQKQIFFPYFFLAEKKFNIHIPSKDDSSELFEEMNSFHDACELNSVLVSYKIYNKLTVEEFHEWLQSKPHIKNGEQIKNIIHSNRNLGLTLTMNYRGMSLKEYGRSDQHLYRISDQRTTEDLSLLYFGSQSKDYMLCSVVLRPFIVNNGLEEIFLNVFRNNGFNIIERVYKKLNEYELNYLSKQEGIEEGSYQQYCKMMATGQVCVVVMANYSSVLLASFLADGYKDFRTQGQFTDNSPEQVDKDTNKLLDLIIQSRNKTKEVILSEFMIAESTGTFRGLANMVNYSYVFYRDLIYEVMPNIFKEVHPSDRLINLRIVRKVYESYREFFSSCSYFNPNIFVPNNETKSNEVISVFSPLSLSKTSCLLIVHPYYYNHFENVKQCLKSLE